MTAIGILLALLAAGLIWAGFTDSNLVDEMRAALSGRPGK